MVAGEFMSFPEYVTFECCRYLSSGHGGYLSLPVLEEICKIYGANLRTITRHLNKAVSHGWAKPGSNGYIFLAERGLHAMCGGFGRKYLGRDSVRILGEELMSFFGNGPFGFREYMFAHGTLLSLAKMQDRAITGTSRDLDKLNEGKQVVKSKGTDNDGVVWKEYKTRDEVEAKEAHYAPRDFQIDLSGLSSNFSRANTDSDNILANNPPDRANARCFIKYRIPSCISKDGEIVQSEQHNNVTTFRHHEPVGADSTTLLPSDFNPRPVNGTGGVKTFMWEANASYSVIASRAGCSVSTVQRRLRKQRKDLLVQGNIAVISVYDPVVARGLMAMPQNSLPLRGKGYPVRTSVDKVRYLESQGYSVSRNNINGDVEKTESCGQVVIWSMMHSYFIFTPDWKNMAQGASQKISLVPPVKVPEPAKTSPKRGCSVPTVRI